MLVGLRSVVVENIDSPVWRPTEVRTRGYLIRCVFSVSLDYGIVLDVPRHTRPGKDSNGKLQ